MNDVLLLPLKILLISLDLALTLLTFGWIGAVRKFFAREPLRSIPVADDPSHRVHPDFKDKLAETPRPGVTTLYDLAADAFQRFANQKCMGTRTFLGWETPKVKRFGPVKWRSFSDVSEEAHRFGAALRTAGVVPAADVTTLEKVATPCRIAIFENTCAEWMIAAIGAFTQSVAVTTVYATLGMDAVVEAVVDNSIKVLVCNKKDVPKLALQCNKMKTLTHIVYTNDVVAPDDNTQLPPEPKGMRIISFEEFCASGDTDAFPPTPPKPDSCAVVMYTSGSTGKPKGVIITHRQLVGCCAAADIALGVREGEDVYIAYLPLAHILELMAEFVMITMGVSLCYADPRSLSRVNGQPGALEVFSPTLMIAVPKIWDTIKKGIDANVAKAHPLLQFIVKTAFAWRKFAMKHGFDTPLFKILVFKKFAETVGGKLRYAFSGGGPLSADVQETIRAAFGCPLVQGYGLTETCAGLAVQAEDDLRGGIAGAIIPSIECKLVSTPDVGDRAGQPYLSTDKFDVDGNEIHGRGEVVVRGTNLAVGYYMMQEVTNESFGEDGWFYTGDIGQFMSDGSIRIVDRKKNLVKLKGGEYIALEKMEMTYGNSDFVDALAGGICCYGDGEMDRPVALMQLNKATTMKWATSHGFTDDFDTIKNMKELYDAVMEDLNKQHAKSDLSHLEKLVAVALLTTHWTTENGCLTAASKLQRREVIRQFSKEFEQVKQKGIFH